ncbi:hypothetical protein D1007_61435 [Hordeum vulgare]|nr:hypothetical protein D1007_61435 [Hordeum vulgare]
MTPVGSTYLSITQSTPQPLETTTHGTGGPFLPGAQSSIDGLPAKQHEHGGGQRGRGGGVRTAGLGAVRVRGRADVGGLRKGSRCRCTQRALLPLRHAPWQGAQPGLRRSGCGAPLQGGPVPCWLPLWGPVQARHRRPCRRWIRKREEPRRRLPLLAQERKLPSSQPPMIHQLILWSLESLLVTCLCTMYLSSFVL